jgi:hypothetical protein
MASEEESSADVLMSQADFQSAVLAFMVRTETFLNVLKSEFDHVALKVVENENSIQEVRKMVVNPHNSKGTSLHEEEEKDGVGSEAKTPLLGTPTPPKQEINESAFLKPIMGMTQLLKAGGHLTELGQSKDDDSVSNISSNENANRKTKKQGNHSDPSSMGGDHGDDGDDDRKCGGKEPSRRKSMIHKAAEYADNPRTQITMIQQPPSSDHIQLYECGLWPILRFIEETNEYQTKHGVSLNITARVKAKVRRHLIAKNPGMTEKKFYQQSTIELLRMLMKEVKPRSVLEFQHALQEHVYFGSFPKGYVADIVNFEPMYNALLAYKARFLQAYEVLAEDNDSNVPECNNKDGGLIKIFLSKIPFDYGNRKYKEMKCPKCDNIYRFLTLFYAQVDDDHNQHVKSSVKNQCFDKASQSHLLGKPLVRVMTRGKSYPRVSSQKLHAIPAAEMADGYDEDNELFPKSRDQHEDDSLDEVLYSQLDGNGIGFNTDHSTEEPDEIEDDFQLDQELSALQHNVPKKAYDSSSGRKTKGCITMAIYRKCGKGKDCLYSHEPTAVSEAREFCLKLLLEGNKDNNRSIANTSKPMVVSRKPPGEVSPKLN